jgi:hypothetical protein
MEPLVKAGTELVVSGHQCEVLQIRKDGVVVRVNPSAFPAFSALISFQKIEQAVGV